MATYTVCFVVLLSCALMSVVWGDVFSSGNNSQFFVSSNRLGCEIVDSQQPCPATILSPDLAIDYETDTDMVNITLDDILNATPECISALTTTYCSSLTPRCYANGSKDYGDARMACWKANRTCPQDSLEKGTCEELKVGLKPLSACVKPSRPINGSCPQPKYKMPEEKLDLYLRSSVEYQQIGYFAKLSTARYTNGTRMFSFECVSKIKELYCLPFYCSPDEQQVIVEYTYEDCEDIFSECFDTVIDNLYEGPLKEAIIELQDRYIDNCIFYPDAIEPTESFSGSGNSPTEITTSTFQNVLFTPSGKKLSSTPPGNNVSTTPGNNVSTTPGNKVSTTPGNNVSTPPGNNVSTPPGNNVSTTPQQEIPFTTPGQNISSTSPRITSHPKDTKKFTPSRKTGIIARILKTPSPTAGNDRCQNFPPLLLLLFLLVLAM